MNDIHPIGTRTLTARGYIFLKVAHGSKGWKLEHVHVAEAALGRPLPRGVVVHHVNDARDENQNGNLCILQSDLEHKRLRARRKVLRSGGDPWMDLWCSGCQAPRPATEFSTCHYRGPNARPPMACRACTNRRRRIA